MKAQPSMLPPRATDDDEFDVMIAEILQEKIKQ